MKKNIFKIMLGLFGFLLLGVFFNSCKSEQPITRETPKTINFEIRTEQVVIPLYPEDTGDSPRMHLTIDTLYVSNPLKQLVQELLYDGTDPQVYKDQLVDHYKNQYFEMRAYPDLPLPLNWDYTETINLDTPLSKIMVISRTMEYYLGGAHGIRNKQYFVLDMGTQKQLRLENLVKADMLPILQQYIEAELRVFSEIEPSEPLTKGGFFEDRIEIPENFFFTSEGLGFYWNPYEIAPYVMGPIEVVFPYKKIKDLLSF